MGWIKLLFAVLSLRWTAAAPADAIDALGAFLDTVATDAAPPRSEAVQAMSALVRATAAALDENGVYEAALADLAWASCEAFKRMEASPARGPRDDARMEASPARGPRGERAWLRGV